MVRNREANVLAKTFRDQMSVYRTRRVRDPETQGTVEKEILVYEDHVEITYNFFDDMGIWGEQEKPEVEKK